MGNIVIPDVQRADYWTEGTWPRAWRETRKAIPTGKFAVAALLLTAATVVPTFGFLADSTNRYAWRLVVTVAVLLSGFLASLGFVLLYKLVKTPGVQRDEARTDRTKLRAEFWPDDRPPWPEIEDTLKGRLLEAEALIAHVQACPDTVGNYEIMGLLQESDHWANRVERVLQVVHQRWCNAFTSAALKRTDQLSPTPAVLQDWLERKQAVLKGLVDRGQEGFAAAQKEAPSDA